MNKINLINIQLTIQAWSKQVYEDFLNHQIEEGEIVFPINELPERTIPELILSRGFNTFTCTMHITNLLDTDYKLIQDFPMPRRTWQFTITKTLN